MGVLVVCFSSCTTYKKLQLLQGNLDSTRFSKLNIPEQSVQIGDQLSITVFSDNAAASAIYNTGSPGSLLNQQNLVASTGNSGTANVYEVDQEGMIYFPQLGKLKIEGLTKKGIVDLLNSRLRDRLLTNPYYVINFINLKITVFGDVNHPGVFPITRANMNIFEALTLAGDLTYFGKRENVLVIREQGGKRVFGRIDLTSPAVFESPYYYLQQNDMVFVDMRKDKVNGTDVAWLRNASLLLSFLTTVTILVNIFR